MPTPRLDLPGPSQLPFSRHVDADSLDAEVDVDRVVRNQSVLRVADLLGAATSSPRKPCASPRPAAFAAPESPPRFGVSPPSPFVKRKHAASPRAGKMSPLTVLPPRAPSPVGDLPTDSVVSIACLLSPGVTALRSPRRAILGQSDVQKITKWLESLSREAASFSSYALYCEMLFRESRVLTQGKPVPNRLQTAVAFHCLCKATSVFARHEGILLRICKYVRCLPLRLPSVANHFDNAAATWGPRST
jgi:hypothetical protein